MTDQYHYIEDYFEGRLAGAEKTAFEARWKQDSGFADDVNFYLQTTKFLEGELRARKNKEVADQYEQWLAVQKGGGPVVRRIRPYIVAAAASVLLFFGWFFFLRSASPEQLATAYIQNELNTVGISMAGREDSLQLGKAAYNEGRLPEAAAIFESLLERDPASAEAGQLAGLTRLRLSQYDAALVHFRRLENRPGLYANPGAFLQALTLLKRNGAGDIDSAKRLLQKVVSNKLEGAETASEWLRKL